MTHWTNAETSQLEQMWGQWSLSEIAERLGRSRESVRKKSQAMRLSKTKVCEAEGCGKKIPQHNRFCGFACYKSSISAKDKKRCSECSRTYYPRANEGLGTFRNRKTCSRECASIRQHRMANKNSAKERALTQVEKEIQRVENLYQKYANLYGGPPYRCARPVETVKYRVM